MQSAPQQHLAHGEKSESAQRASLPERFGQNLARRRKAAGLTQAQLAAKISYSDKIVSKWERGEGLPDLPTALALSEILQVSLDMLLQDPAAASSMPRADVWQTGTGAREPARGRRIFIHLLSSLLPFLVAATAYVTLQMTAAPFGGELLFLYAVPVSGIVSTVFSSLWWGALPRICSVSLLCWGGAFSFWLSLRNFGGAGAIFATAAVMQVLTVLWFLMPGRNKRGVPSSIPQTPKTQKNRPPTDPSRG